MIEIETLNDKGECIVTTSSRGNQNDRKRNIKMGKHG